MTRSVETRTVLDAEGARFVVLGKRIARAAFDANQFVGRDAELQFLVGALEFAMRGRGARVAVVGEPGIGKSRLVREFLAQVPASVRPVVVRCASLDATAAYALVSSLLRASFRIQVTADEGTARAGVVDALSGERVAPDAAEVQLVLNVLGYGERFPFRPESRRSILADVLRRLLIAYGQHNPIVLVAEDMHWADDASVGVLSEVSEVVDSLPCLFLVTARPGWQPTWSAERLVLRPLERREAGLLAQAAARFELEPRVAERIVDRAEGNPFFLEELARSSNAASAEAPGVGQFGVPQVPPSIRELLQAQLDRLPAKTKRAVWAAAVCGRAFRLAIVQRLVPDLELVSELNTLQDEGLLVHGAVGSDAEYGFRHSLIHEVAYAMQLRDQRRSLHGAVGAALEDLYPSRTDELVHELAFHYGRGSDAEKARTWLVRAGDRARALFANAESEAYYAAALEWSASGSEQPTQAAILERTGDVRARVGQTEAALVSFHDALQQLPATARLDGARLKRKIGVALGVTSAYADAVSALDDARTVLGGSDEEELARIEVAIGHIEWRRGNYASAHEVLSRAVRRNYAAEDVRAEALKHLGTVAVHMADLPAAETFYERSSTIFGRLEDHLGLGDVRNNLGIVYRRLARHEEALAQWRVALQLRERTGDRRGLGATHNNLGELYRLLGDLPKARSEFGRAFEIWDGIGDSAFAALALIGRGATQVDNGEVDSGRLDLVEAEKRLLALDQSWLLPEVYRYLGSAELARGDLDAAQHAAQRALNLARDAGAPQQQATSQRVLGEIALRRGDRELARQLLDASRLTLIDIGEADEVVRTEAVLRASGMRF